MRIIRREIEKTPEKRYTVMDASMAIGISENAIYAYFSAKHITVKGGITLDQIDEVLMARRRGSGINWDNVHEIVHRLDVEKGVTIVFGDEEITDTQKEPEQIDLFAEEA